ncbi:MAG: hypothetical protein NUV81_03320 [bacterium]|nr:hypothetical protein [bacterium]
MTKQIEKSGPAIRYIDATIDTIAKRCAEERITAGTILAISIDVNQKRVQIVASAKALTTKQIGSVTIQFKYQDCIKSFAQIGANGNPGQHFHYQVTQGIVDREDLERILIGELSQICKADGTYADEILFATPRIKGGFIQRIKLSGRNIFTVEGADSVCYSKRYNTYFGRSLNTVGVGIRIIAIRRTTAHSDVTRFMKASEWRTVIRPQFGTAIQSLARFINDGDEITVLPVVIASGIGYFDRLALITPRGSSGFDVSWSDEQTPTTREAIGTDIDAPGTFFSQIPGNGTAEISIQPTRKPSFQSTVQA